MQGKPENPISPNVSESEINTEVASAHALANLLDPTRVACNVTARSKKHCLEIVSRLLTNDQDSLHYSEIFDAIYQRERLGSTALGQGFALPHGRVGDLDSSIGAFLMLTTPIDFDQDGEDDVDMIFALAVPQNSDEQHLGDLSTIAQLLSSTNLRERVGNITSCTKLYEALKELANTTSTNEPPTKT